MGKEGVLAVAQRAPRLLLDVRRLSRKQAKAFGTFLDELAAVGCRALAYRLSGPAPVDHLCRARSTSRPTA